MTGRRLIALGAALLALAAPLAGCGGGKKGSDIADPRAEVLSYFPRETPLVALIATDPKGAQYRAVSGLAAKFPGSALVFDRFKQEISKLGSDYDKDIRPLLGNDAAIGSPGAGASGGAGQTLFAFVARDAGKLEQVAKRRTKHVGSYRGAELYSDTPRTTFALRGSVVVVADTTATVKAALDRHESKQGLSTAAFNSRLGALPKDALVRVVGNAGPLLAGPGSAKARRVPWVGALGTFALTLRAAPGGLTSAFRVDTGDANLAPGDLPLADGPQPPSLLTDQPVAVGVRDLSHIVDFAQRAANAVDPIGFGKFEDAKNKIRSGFRVDLDSDIAGQLSGDASVITDLQKVAVRAQVRDPKAMAQTLTRLVPVLPSLFQGAGLPGATVTAQPNGTYTIQRGGKRVASYGLVDGVLVAGSVPPDRIDDIARATTSPAPAAHGAVALHAAGDRLVAALGQALHLGAAGLVLGALGDLTGWVRAETGGLRGELHVAVG